MSFSDKINGSMTIGMYLLDKSYGISEKRNVKKQLRTAEKGAGVADENFKKEIANKDAKLSEANNQSNALEELQRNQESPAEDLSATADSNFTAANDLMTAGNAYADALRTHLAAQQSYSDVATRAFQVNPTAKSFEKMMSAGKQLRDYDRIRGQQALQKMLEEYQVRVDAARKQKELYK